MSGLVGLNVKSAVKGCAATTTVTVLLVAVAALLSLTVATTVCDAFVEKVVVNVEVVAPVWTTPSTDQVNE